jgi:hypothetical protein
MNADQIAAAKARLEAYEAADAALMNRPEVFDGDANGRALSAFCDCWAALEEHMTEDLSLALAEIDGEGSRKALALFEIESLRIDLEKQRLEICRLQGEVLRLEAFEYDFMRERGKRPGEAGWEGWNARYDELESRHAPESLLG